MSHKPEHRSLGELTFDEVNAILVHKWHLSEKAGHDVGMEFASADFFKHHAAAWRKRKIEEDLHIQKDEILRHKWYLSEKMGREIGTTQAALDWIACGYAGHWRNRTGPYKNRK